MDWRRAKTLCIVLLVFLNIFLMTTLLYGNAIGSGQPTYNEDVLGVLYRRSIVYSGVWPDSPSNEGVLRFENTPPDPVPVLGLLMPNATMLENSEGGRVYASGSRTLSSELTELGAAMLRYVDVQAGYTISTEDNRRRDEGIEALLNAIGFPGSQFVFEKEEVTVEGIWLTYVESYRGGKLFDNVARFLLVGNGVAEIELKHRAVIQMMPSVDGGMDDILSAQQALVLSPLRGPIDIANAEFGWAQEHSGEQYFSPVWRFQATDGKVFFINAYNGQINDFE